MAPPVPSLESIKLTNLITNLSKNYLKSEPSTDYRLRRDPFLRAKVAVLIRDTKETLRKAEQEANNIRILNQRQAVQADLLRKAEVLEQVERKLKELEDTAIDEDDDDDVEDAEDLLAVEELIDEEGEKNDSMTAKPEQTLWEGSQGPFTAVNEDPTSITGQQQPTRPDREELFPSSLRARNTQQPHSSTTDTAHTTSSSTNPAPNSLTETLLTHNRTEQEALTTSMLSLAQALKASANAISDSLDLDADIVDKTVDGLDRNTSGLEAAQRSMGYLVRMSEGKGWFGRLMLYAWILGLNLAAFFIVAFLPKLRF